MRVLNDFEMKAIAGGLQLNSGGLIKRKPNLAVGVVATDEEDNSRDNDSDNHNYDNSDNNVEDGGGGPNAESPEPDPAKLTQAEKDAIEWARHEDEKAAAAREIQAMRDEIARLKALAEAPKTNAVRCFRDVITAALVAGVSTWFTGPGALVTGSLAAGGAWYVSDNC